MTDTLRQELDFTDALCRKAYKQRDRAIAERDAARLGLKAERDALERANEVIVTVMRERDAMKEVPDGIRLLIEDLQWLARNLSEANANMLRRATTTIIALQSEATYNDRLIEELRKSLALSEGHTRDASREAEVLREALIMVRDADDDCHRDWFKTIPAPARAKIDAALATHNCATQKETK